MRVLGIQVSLPREVEWQGKKHFTGIFKEAVKEPVRVGRLHIEGDGVGDPRYHGGADKAVYGYPADVYPWWKKRLGVELPFGSFGENLTIEGLDETQVACGDILRIGTVELEASEPRFPCATLGMKFRDMSIIKTFLECGHPGVYFRVRREGILQPGDEVKWGPRAPSPVSIRELELLKIGPNPDPERLKAAIACPTLPDGLRKKFQSRLTSTAVKTN